MNTLFLRLFGVILEKWMVAGVCWMFFIIFIINKIVVVFRFEGNPNSIEQILYAYYSLLIKDNIGTITTIATVFVGIYITVLSVLTSIKVNSVMSLLGAVNFKKVVKFIVTGLIASFVMIFYSLITTVISNLFIQAFFFFLILLWMLLTSLRFGINLCLIYYHELDNLLENLKNEKEEDRKNKELILMLERYLERKESEMLEK